jgi:type VI secretion system protein VasI
MTTRHILAVGLAIFGLFVCMKLAHSQDVDKDIAKCSAIEGDLARLECFDNLSRSRGLNKPQNITPSITGKGDWHIFIDKNPVDDTRTVHLGLQAGSEHSRGDETPLLIIRCKSNETDLYIVWHDYLGSEAYVLTRIGDEKAETKEWSLSTKSEATIYPASPIAFIKKVMTHDQLIAEVTPYNENPVTLIFKTTGLVNAIKPVQETCHWK